MTPNNQVMHLILTVVWQISHSIKSPLYNSMCNIWAFKKQLPRSFSMCCSLCTDQLCGSYYHTAKQLTPESKSSQQPHGISVFKSSFLVWQNINISTRQFLADCKSTVSIKFHDHL
jgi:hypothetical protein